MAGPIKLLFVYGTRREAVRLAPLVEAARANPVFDSRVVSTGQQDEPMDPVLSVFRFRPDYEFKLARPGLDLPTLFGRIMGALSPVLAHERPNWIVAHGDTITCAAAALTGFYSGVPVAHVSAGLRTHDLSALWPEEFNRRISTVATSMHFAPTFLAQENLIREGADPARVLVTGSTGIDALVVAYQHLRANETLRQRIARRFKVLRSDRRLVLVTVRRHETAEEHLRCVLRGLLRINRQHRDVNIAALIDVTPSVRAEVRDILGDRACWEHDPSGEDCRVFFHEPVDYFSFLALMEKADLVLTDSGDIQEEAPTLRKPVLILREANDRPEAVRAGSAVVVGYDEELMVTQTSRILEATRARALRFPEGNPFGDGSASGRILRALEQTEPRARRAPEAPVPGPRP